MKKTLSLILVSLLILCVCCVPAAAEGESTKVTVVISNKEIVLPPTEIEISDADGDGSLTVNDALYCVHKAKFNGGADAGYATAEGQYGLYIVKLWGTENGGSYGYYVNNVSAFSLTDKIKDGDFIYAFVYTDTAAFSDAYSFFDKASVEMKKGEKLELTLSSAGYDENWSPVTLPVSGAEILIDGKKSGIMTDENGKAVIDFKNAGSCIISASSESKLLVPPVCAVSFQKDTALTPALIIIIAVAVILAAGVVIFVSKRKNK